MDKPFITDQIFEKQDYTEKPLPVGDYENCRFIKCDFSNSPLSYSAFTECEFQDCNLSLALLNQTALRDVKFSGCKMPGLHFDHCIPFLFAVSFTHCQLNLSSFYQMSMKKTPFSQSTLLEVDFTETDLSGAVFNDCDLALAIFDHTNLEKADLRGARNYSIDPEKNRIRKGRYSLSGLPGLLGAFDIEIE